MTNVSPVRVIAVTGGKGGVGKTSISVNLSIALAGMGKNIMLMDADLGLANVDVMLGLQPKKDLSQLLKGECTLDEVVVSGPDGVLIVAGLCEQSIEFDAQIVQPLRVAFVLAEFVR